MAIEFKDFQFCEDFGDGPLLLGRITDDRSIISVVSLLGAFIAMAALGFPGLALVAFAALNDFSYAGKTETDRITGTDNQSIAAAVNPVESEPIDIPADTVAVSMDMPIVTVVEQPIAAAPSYGISRVLTPLDRVLASPYQSRAWFGSQRTGKSFFCAVASQQMVKTIGTKVFHVNLHSFGNEDKAYWVHSRSVTGDMGHMPENEVYQLIDRAIGVVRDFQNSINALLIFDEIVLTGATANPYAEALQPLLKMVASSCSELSSTGKKRRQAVWSISPDFVAGQLTVETKVIKSLACSFVAIPPGRSLDWEGQAIGFHSESFQNVQRNFAALKDAPRLDCDRMVFLDGLWLDMGQLPKLMTAKVDPIALPSPSSEPVTTEVETVAIDDRPRGLNDYPLVATIYDYLGSKEPRTIKQISDAMRNSGKISDEILQAKIPNYSNYKDGIRSVLSFGISNGFLVQIGDSYQAVKPS